MIGETEFMVRDECHMAVCESMSMYVCGMCVCVLLRFSSGEHLDSPSLCFSFILSFSSEGREKI